MPAQWYYFADGRKNGPFSPQEFQVLARSGAIRADSRVADSVSGTWRAASTIKGLLPPLPRCAAEPHGTSNVPAVPVPPPLPPPVIDEASTSSVVGRDERSGLGLGGVTLVGWMAISAGATIAISSAILVCVLVFGRGDAAVPTKVAVEKPPTEIQQSKNDQPVSAAPMQAPRPVVGVQASIEEKTKTEPQKPAGKETQEIVAQVEPSVVTIEVSKGDLKGTASGFAIDAEGTIATNYHVIEGAKSARVVFRDGKTTDVVGFLAVAPGKDLALLRVGPGAERLNPLTLAKGLPVKGERVLTFGAPLGLAGSVTDGMVSAIRPGAEIPNHDIDMTWIQTTAQISHGNSGGPLVNLNGEVIGVNTWYWKDERELNFAVSALHVVQLRDKGTRLVQPLANLLPPRVDERLVAAKEQQRRANEERQRQLDETTRQDAKIAEIQREEAKQRELSRLNDRMAIVKADIAGIEQQGVALTARRGQVFAQATAADAAGRKVADQISTLQGQIANMTNAIDSRILNGVKYLEGANDDAFIDLRNQRQSASDQLASLQEKYASLAARYTGLDASAQELKGQIEYLSSKRADRVSELRGLQVQHDQLLRTAAGASTGPVPSNDAAAAKAWRQITRGMKTTEVEALLGKPGNSERAESGGLMWEYKYVESGTTIEIVGVVHFVTGKVVTWQAPAWALEK